MNLTKQLLILCLSTFVAGCCNVDREILLSEGWNVVSSSVIQFSGEEISKSGVDVSEWYDAVVPSTIMGTLTHNGVYEDVLESMNYKNIDRTLFDCPWWYRVEFDMPEMKTGEHAELIFDGLSYRADVWLNGKKIAGSDEIYGVFRRHSLDVTKFVDKHNVLAVKIYRAQPGEPNIGFVDWNPRPADESMGIFREVRIRRTGGVSLDNVAVKSKVNTETLDEAWLTVEAEVRNLSNEPIKGVLYAEYEGGIAEIPVSLSAGETRVISVNSDDCKSLYVKNPRLWWCRNLGTPQMYSMEVKFISNGKKSDSRNVDFGIREIKDYFTEDGHRGFILNGKKVLVRSAGWTDDIFLRNTPESNETEVKYVCGMNLNSIRFENIWGTSQNIYDLCDRYGLLALVGWSCHWEWDNYIGSPCDEFGGIKTEEDMDLIAESLKDQVLWLRNHPSIICWFVGSDMIPRPALEKRYMAFLPKIDNRPYISAAKAMYSDITGPSGMKMAGPYEFVSPEYWYDTNIAPGAAFGFNTETCIGAQLPVIESIKEMIPEDKLWPLNEYWDYHCTTAAEDMNKMDELVENMDARYGKAVNLDDFLRKADWMNYEGTRAMFEAFRANIPNTTGIVQWMLNSAWPSLYWQLYDWYLRPTAGYYSVRDGNADQQLIYNYGTRKVVAVNEGAQAKTLKCRMSIYALDGKLLKQEKNEISVSPSEVKYVFDVPALEKNYFLMLEILGEDGQVISDNYYCLASEDDVQDYANSSWYQTPISKHADFTALNKLPEVSLDIDVSRNGDKVEIIIDNDTEAFAFFVRLSIKDESGKLVTPSFFDDNYVSIAPDSDKKIRCIIPNTTKGRLTLICKGWNVKENTLTF